jgi:hypothetical protein
MISDYVVSAILTVAFVGVVAAVIVYALSPLLVMHRMSEKDLRSLEFESEIDDFDERTGAFLDELEIAAVECNVDRELFVESLNEIRGLETAS